MFYALKQHFEITVTITTTERQNSLDKTTNLCQTDWHVWQITIRSDRFSKIFWTKIRLKEKCSESLSTPYIPQHLTRHHSSVHLFVTWPQSFAGRFIVVVILVAVQFVFRGSQHTQWNCDVTALWYLQQHVITIFFQFLNCDIKFNVQHLTDLDFVGL